MNKAKYLLIATSFCLFTIISCSKEEEEPKSNLVVPTSYESVDYDTNTYIERNLAKKFSSLVALMKQGENPANTLDKSTLLTAYNDGASEGLKAKTGWIAAHIEQIVFADLAKHSGKTYHPDHGDTGTLGGVFQNRLLNNGAFEILQSADKGSYAGMFLFQILELKKGTFDQKALDKMIALYGAHPSFPNTPTAANTAFPDKFIANYVSRRDKNDGNGYYSQIKKEFLTLQAAIQAGSAYDAEKEESFTRLVQTMEKGLAATAINYMYAAIDKLSKTNPTDVDKAGALHDLSEAAGFIQGFMQLNSSYVKIQDNEVNSILLNLFYTSPAQTFYKFTNDPVNSLPNLLAAMDKLKSIYQFSSSDMTDFKTNWVSAQSR